MDRFGLRPHDRRGSANDGPIGNHGRLFQSKKLKHIHIEPFRPENLNAWEPETESDIYLGIWSAAGLYRLSILLRHEPRNTEEAWC